MQLHRKKPHKKKTKTFIDKNERQLQRYSSRGRELVSEFIHGKRKLQNLFMPIYSYEIDCLQISPRRECFLCLVRPRKNIRYLWVDTSSRTQSVDRISSPVFKSFFTNPNDNRISYVLLLLVRLMLEQPTSRRSRNTQGPEIVLCAGKRKVADNDICGV